MVTLRAGFTALFLLLFACPGWLAAQNVYLDYVKNQPHTYTPNDPWHVGEVFRNHMGHGGLFYNCDHQEDKRFSPFIYWQTRQTICLKPWPVVSCLSQQLAEVRQRVDWGRCGASSVSGPPAANISYVGAEDATDASLQPTANRQPNVFRPESRADSGFRMTQQVNPESTRQR